MYKYLLLSKDNDCSLSDIYVYMCMWIYKFENDHYVFIAVFKWKWNPEGTSWAFFTIGENNVASLTYV